MNVGANSGEGGDKRLPEATIQTIAQNLTTIQTVQSTQNVIQSNIQTIQSTQAIVGNIGQPGTLVGKSVSLDLNQKLQLAKPGIPSNIVSSTDSSKLTATLCQMSPTLRIISPNMISSVDRQSQAQNQEPQIVTSIPATYHVPRGPAAVANIASPRATVATPIVRSTTGQTVPTVPISRPGISTTVSNPQWPTKTPYLYVPPQRHPLPIVQRVTTRPAMAAAVYSGGQQPRLVTPSQGRPVQAVQTAVVTALPGVPGTPCRLRAPVLQSNNNPPRLPISQARPSTPQETPPISQAPRTVSQSIQLTQAARALTTATTVSRIAVSAPVIGAASRIASVTSIQPAANRQATTVSTTSVATTVSATVSRIVLPPQQQSIPRVVQTVASVSNLGQVSRVITTVANPANTTRVAQPGTTSMARITGISMHPLPLTPTRTTTATIKTTPVLNVTQTIQPKQPVQQSTLRIVTTGATSSSTNSPVVTNTPPTVQAAYSQFRPGTVQPVRLLVDPNYEEPQHKPNASPRPSILRKRDYDNSPAKGVAKNLTPVLANLPLASSTCSPPGSPRGDRDGGGCQSSGSTTVSATSSPGLDEEPEQSRINMNINLNINLNHNTTVEMSPRKKPRKQQLTSVEISESRGTEEEMQFITEEKIKKEKEEKEKERDKNTSEKKQVVQIKQEIEQTPVRTRPTPSLLGSSWKNRWGGRLHHYRRPSDVRPREERRPTVAELAQQKQVIQKLNGWKIYHLSAQMEDLAEIEKEVHDKLKSTLAILESQQNLRGRQDDGIERANELIKGNMQRSSLISEGMNEARTQLVAIFQHQGHVRGILERCGNKRAQKKRDK